MSDEIDLVLEDLSGRAVEMRVGRNGGLVTMGVEFPEGVDELNVCLWMFGGNGSEWVSVGMKWLYMKRAVDLGFNCVGSIRRVVWNEWTERILRAMIGVWEKKRFLGLAGCSSSGKSDGVALGMLMFYWARPSDTYGFAISTTKQGARTKIWKSITQLWGQAERVGCPGKLIDSEGYIKGVDKRGNLTRNSGIILMAAGSGSEAADACSNLQGAKNPQVIVAGDEFTELGPGILKTAWQNMTSNDQLLFVAMANPNLLTDAFGEMNEPVDGWKSLDLSVERWKTKYGWCERFNAEKSPRIKSLDGERYFWQPDQAYCDLNAEAFGRQSRGYYRFVLAFWCPEGVSNTIYSEVEFLNCSALHEDEPRWDESPAMLSALDPAYSRDGDRSQAAYAKLGKVDGRAHLHFCGFPAIQDDVANVKVPVTHQVVREWKRLSVEEWGARPTRCIMDGTGGGQVVGEIVDVEWSPAVQKVNFKNKASDRTVVFRTEEVGFYNKNSELWMQMKQYLRANQISGISKAAMAELVQREYHKSENRLLRVESKEDFKSRNGGRSPDLADVVLLMVEKAITLGQFAPEEVKQITGTINKGFSRIKRRMGLTTTCGRKLRH